MEVHQYKYIVLELIFLRYLSYAFYERRNELKRLFSDKNSSYYIDDAELRKLALEDEDYYLEAGILYIPEEARWNYLVQKCRSIEYIQNYREGYRNLRKDVSKTATGCNSKSLLAYASYYIFSLLKMPEDLIVVKRF